MPYDLRICLIISIHALREEGDDDREGVWLGNWLFLSTPSARRATPVLRPLAPVHADFYPRPPRGGRLLREGLALGQLDISIHALREEGDSLPYWLS